MNKRVVSVFGNEMDPQDSMVVKMVPELQKKLPDVDFQLVDPTESLEPPSDPWIILDVGMGIDEVVVVEDLKQLDQVKGQSVHDFDVYMELRLREKLGQLPKIKIIIVPALYAKEKAFDRIEKILKKHI